MKKIIEWLLTSGLQILFILVGAYVVIRILRYVINRINRFFEDEDPTTRSEREKRAETLTKILNNIMSLIVWSFAGMMILKELGVEIGPILAGAGIAGLAVGFGAQSLVKDFLNGMFIVVENEYRVGDVVQIAGIAGLVEKISLRTTVLRDLEGKVHVVPNGEITTVTNMTKEWSRFLTDVGVAYKENVDDVMKVLQDLGKEMQEDEKYGSLILEPLTILGVDSFGDSSVNIRIMMTTQPLQQWTVGREFRRRMKNRFDELGIEIPFPHTTVYLGEGEPMNNRLAVELMGEKGAAEEAGGPSDELMREDE
ncbi:MAG: mechanosensitive ion channel [Candidatus Eisenbacteria bacterium]|nr:mechanosensitive ion channel [Candidatus Eisenbacteria bacterium]